MWRALATAGHRVIAGRLLPPALAAVEARAVSLLGHPLGLPLGLSDERAAEITSALDALDAAQRERDAPEPEGGPRPEPLSDDEIDAILGLVGDVELVDGAFIFRRGSDAARVSQLVARQRAADGAYTLEVDGVLFTWPARALDERPRAASATVAADELTPELIALLFEFFADDPAEMLFRVAPVERAARPHPETGIIAFRSFERIRLEDNIELPRAVVAALVPDTLYTLYGRMGRHDGHGAPIVWTDNALDRIQPMKIGNRLHNHLRGDAIPVGSLYGIDAARWKTVRGYVAAIAWELRPMPVEREAPGPFRVVAPGDRVEGELANCVLRVVREKLTAGTSDANCGRGHRPASKRQQEKRLRALAAADAVMAVRGFTLADIEALERACDIRLRCVDIAGNEMLERPAHTGRAARRALVNVVLHDHHGWADIPTSPPAISVVRGYDRVAENALAAAAAEHKDNEHRRREATTTALLDFVARAIPHGTRSWLCGEEVVTHRGELYRSAAAARALDLALEEFTGCRGGDLPADAPPAVAVEHDTASRKIGGAGTYRFGKWLEREQIRPTPERLRAAWQHAQVEAAPWHSELDGSKAKHFHIDMRAAYLACDRRETRAASEAADEVGRYGFPDARAMRTARLDNAPLTVASPALQLTGAIQLSAWRFSENAHPFTPWRVGAHLAEHAGWITTPELRDLLAAGDLETATGRQIVFSVGKLSGITFPTASAAGQGGRGERDQAVRFVGKLARHADESSVVTHDSNEAAYLANSFGRAGRYISHRDGAAYLINYTVDKRAQWFHVRAFVLAYTNIALRRMLRRFDPRTVLRVNTDAIYATELPAAVSALLHPDEPTIRWGQWREKDPGYVFHPMREAPRLTGECHPDDPLPAAGLPPNPADCPGVDGSAVPAELTGTALAATLRMLVLGQGGCGKTFVIAQALQAAGADFAIACPSNELANEHARTLGCRTYTYHKLLALPTDKPLSTWDPQALGHKLDRLPKTLVWDEGGMVPTAIFEAVLPYLHRRGIQVIALMGPGQLNPFADKQGPSDYLHKWADRVITFDIDKRSLDDELRQLKREVWMVDDRTQLRVLRQRVPAVSFEELVRDWNPRDLVLCSTNALGAAVGTRLLAEHQARFPAEAAPIRYQPDDKSPRRSASTLIPVPGVPGREVPAARGTIEWVPLDTVAVDGLGPDWVYAGWSTIHCVQGKTVSAPRRLFLVDHKLDGWLSNAVYTAISRVRQFSQLRRATPPPGADAYIVPSTLQSTPCSATIAARLRQHRAADIAAGRLPPPAVQLDVERVLELNATQDGKCAHCGCALLLQGFKPRSPQAFSIDRIDDARGHARDNVVLSCYSCNIRHRV